MDNIIFSTEIHRSRELLYELKILGGEECARDLATFLLNFLKTRVMGGRIAVPTINLHQ